MRNKPYTVISFYTQEWHYKKYALELEKNCDRLELPHIITELESTGRYMDNTKLKPVFIKQCLEELRAPVVWIDCDSHLLKRPVFLEMLPDDVVMAAKKKPGKNVLTWYVAVLWFRYCPESLAFIDRWISEQEDTSGGDHTAMERAWRAAPIPAAELPEDYGIVLGRGQPPRGTIALRISDWPLKNKEMKETMAKVKRNII